MIDRLCRLFCIAGLWWFIVPAKAGFFDGEQQPLLVWPNIPVISASDVEEYKLDRELFRGLHTGETNPATAKTNLKQVDRLYQHHKERATDRVWRSYTADLVGQYDQLIKRHQIHQPQLEFSYDGVSPAALENALDLQSEQITALRERDDVAGVVAFVTNTKMSNNQLRSTLTLIRLKDGLSKSLTVTDQLHKLAFRHAQLLFDLLYGANFPDYMNPLEGVLWLLPAPTDRVRAVPWSRARLGCRSQKSMLPTVDQLMMGEQAGPYHNGIILQPGSFYHAADSTRYLAGHTNDPRGKVRRVKSDRQSGRYFCMQPRPQPQSVQSASAQKTDQKSAQKPPVKGSAAPGKATTAAKK